jgi:hypothetical protein
MSALVPLPITPPPGVVVTETSRVAEGRWILPFDKIRFVNGRPQKIGGNIRLTSTPMSGTPRTSLAWRDFLQNQYYAAGTYRKLYAFDSSWTLNDITPFSSTGALGANPFTTSNGSAGVVVAQTTHGRSVGDTAIFSGASTFNNVTMNGTFIVTSVVDGNNFTVVATTTANNSGAGGGAAVTFQYEIPIGTELGAFGQGWGVGPWGLGTWGTPRGSSTIFFEPRVWALDHFGVVLLATYNGGTLWAFDPTQNQPWPRAVSTFNGIPMNAPTDFRSMFITPERFVVGLCDKMVVKVCSQNDPTTWTPATDNTAFQRTLQEGTKLIAGRVLAPYISLIWTDAALYIFQYTGSQFVYNSSMAGKDCGLLGPNAAVTVDGVAYWMGADHNFYMFNGSVQRMPRQDDVRKYIFDAIPDTLGFQCCAILVPNFREIWFFYPTIGANNPTNYVIYSIINQCFAPGVGDFYSSLGVVAARASGTHFTQGDTSTLMAGTDGYVYEHDGPNDANNDNGNPLTWTMTLAPYAMQEGMQSMHLAHMLFDFKDQVGNISATVNTFDRLTDAAPMDSETETIPDTNAGLTDFRVEGRYLGLTLSSSDLGNYMRSGKHCAFVRPTGKRN